MKLKPNRCICGKRPRVANAIRMHQVVCVCGRRGPTRSGPTAAIMAWDAQVERDTEAADLAPAPSRPLHQL